MKAPISWLKDFVDIDLPLEELAYRLTMAGLEVEAVHFAGLPMPESDKLEFKVSGLEWDREKVVVGAIHEVMDHPNADRLVLCRLDDGEQEHTVLTGAPNLFPFKGKGPLEQPLKVAYAREGATIINAYEPGHQKTRLTRRKIRGVESYSMACSERELAISDDHEGIIILDEDAPVGEPLVDYMGDAVLDIAIMPNIARNANILGIAREIAAITGNELKKPSLDVKTEGPKINGRVSIQINQPELNPRFVLGLIEDVEIQSSPYWVQRRLHLAGMRPINRIVDATNYVMLEIGEPLHAFDYDILLKRAKAAGKEAPTIITRAAEKGERLMTLDDVERELDEYTVLVCDQSGPLALAGVMGGAESEVGEDTKRVLLEGAAWNMINTRRTVISQKLDSEAAYRFSRGVHPAMAERGVLRGLELMRQWSNGKVSEGLVDNYPLPPEPTIVQINPDDIKRWLGIILSTTEIAEILTRLEFVVEVDGNLLRATTPDHRLDIGEGVIGKADLIEEIARVYGYDRIEETRMADELPPQRGNPALELEEDIRDLLVSFGLQEAITYRMTTPEREAQFLPPKVESDGRPYVRLANPITSERTVLRQSILASVLEMVERNARIRERIALFEIGPIFLASGEGELPEEPSKLAVAITGPRELPTWQGADTTPMDIFDLKGILQSLFQALHIDEIQYESGIHPSFHPGKRARVMVDGEEVGHFGELHPLVAERYDLLETPVIMGEIDMEVLEEYAQKRFALENVPDYPPVLEDIALVVDEGLPAAEVERVIRQVGGDTVTGVRLFDVYRGEQIGEGKKSLAYRLTYQAPDRTLTDEEVAQIRNKIVEQAAKKLDAKLRG